MANDRKGSSVLEVTLSFLIGTATGFILGVLFAPASGKETRRRIKQEAAKAGEKAKERYEKIAGQVRKSIKLAKEKTGLGAVKEVAGKKKA